MRRPYGAPSPSASNAVWEADLLGAVNFAETGGRHFDRFGFLEQLTQSLRRAVFRDRSGIVTFAIPWTPVSQGPRVSGSQGPASGSAAASAGVVSAKGAPSARSAVTYKSAIAKKHF